MTNSFCRPILGLLLVAAFVAVEVHADSFEFLTYSPPPSGWTKAAAKDGTVYTRTSGIGLVYFYNCHAATRTAADEFAAMWHARVGPTLPGPAPQPQIQRDGEYTVAVGSNRFDAQGTITTVAFVAIVGRGRALGILAMTTGEEALKEVMVVLDSVKIGKGTPAGTTPNTGSSSPGGIEVDFDVPPGYVSQRDGAMVILKPAVVNRTAPCIYGISPARLSSGRLEADAAAAILEPLPGWQIKSAHHNAMRGTAGAGWPYHWIRTDVQQLVGGSYQYLTAMAMAFPAGSGRVNIVWGFGSTGPCTVDDLSFLRLFFSLRPRGWTSDGGKALARELQGLWRDTQRAGMAQYKFLPSGRYAHGLGTSTTFGNLETRTGSVGNGRYSIRDAELTITPDARGASKYRVRIYDEYLGGVWRRAMSLLNESTTPPLDVQYMRIEE